MPQGVKTMQDLPDDVVDFLNGLAGFEFTNKFLEKHGLKPEQDVEVVNLVWDTVLGQMALVDLPAEIEKRLGLPADKAKEAAVELAGHRLLPISGVVGNVAEQIKNWGGDLSQFKGEGKVDVPELTAESFVEGALKELGVSMEDKVKQHRLELILVSYAKGVRDMSEAVGTLARAQKVGGLDMAKEDAEALLKAMDQKLSFINISFQEGAEEPSKPEEKKPEPKKVTDVRPPAKKPQPKPEPSKLKPPKPEPKPAEKPKPKKQAKEDPVLGVLLNDQQKTKKMVEEIGQLAAKRKAKRKPEPKKDTAGAAKQDLKVEVEAKKRNDGAPQAVAKAEVKKGPAKKKPAKKIDTSILQKPAAPGADDFGAEDEEEIKRIASVKAKALAGSGNPEQKLIEQIIGTAKLKFENDEIKQRFVKAVDSRIRDVRDIYEVRSQLEDPIDKGGIGLTGAKLAETVQVIDRLVNEYQNKLQAETDKKKSQMMAQKREQEAQAAQAARQQQEQLMAKRYAEITGQAPTEAIVGSVTRTSAAMSAEETMARQEQQIDAQKVKQAVLGASTAAPKQVQMSASSIPAGGSKPQVQDVRFTRRLAGPIEELRNMTAVEFRRLSTDPEEAIEKIKDKITLVEDQGYDQKIAAIKAWRSSPINQQYLSVSREALLAGKKIQDLLKEKGEGGLTEGELSAIMKLNGELHF